jgi:hypothetical protein
VALSVPQSGRECAACRIFKAAEHFTVLRRGQTVRLYSYCRPCANAKREAMYARRPGGKPEYQRQQYQKRKPERLAYMAKYRDANREKLRAYDRHRYDPDRRHDKERVRFKKYGLTGEAFARLVAAQGGVCAICHRQPGNGLSVDHCHATGVVRGLLCTRCNTSIGRMKDSPSLLRAAAAYLEERMNGVLPKGAN